MKFRFGWLFIVGLALSGCAQVDVKDLSDSEFKVSVFYHGVPGDFEHRALARKAESLCPNGYEYLTRHATKPGEFAQHHGQCSQGQICDHELIWHIRCGNIPREPFSFFGKI
jgi:hypothetical protein